MPGKPIVLCLSGLDPSGGAGIQADIEALFANGCHCLPVITSLTVQDTCNVIRTQTVDVDLLRAQIDTVLADIKIHAIKIGLIDNIEVVRLIAEVMTDNPGIPVVADPVLKAGGGYAFGSAELTAAYRSLILPLTTVLTPNTEELLMLGPDSDDLDGAASALMSMGCQHILLTGTHSQTRDVINTLYHPDAPAESWTWPRLPGSYHGSGCTLAAALAAGLAQCLPLSQAAASAQAYTWHALQQGWRAGQGQFLADRRTNNRCSPPHQ